MILTGKGFLVWYFAGLIVHRVFMVQGIQLEFNTKKLPIRLKRSDFVVVHMICYWLINAGIAAL